MRGARSLRRVRSSECGSARSLPDPVSELRAFADKYGLAFTLLSDTDHRVAERYGVWSKLNLGGRVLWGNQRSTVLVDPLGNVARVFPDVRPDEHDELVLAALAEPRGVISGVRANARRKR